LSVSVDIALTCLIPFRVKLATFASNVASTVAFVEALAV
jgi:hypothetical protein